MDSKHRGGQKKTGHSLVSMASLAMHLRWHLFRLIDFPLVCTHMCLCYEHVWESKDNLQFAPSRDWTQVAGLDGECLNAKPSVSSGLDAVLRPLAGFHSLVSVLPGPMGFRHGHQGVVGLLGVVAQQKEVRSLGVCPCRRTCPPLIVSSIPSYHEVRKSFSQALLSVMGLAASSQAQRNKVNWLWIEIAKTVNSNRSFFFSRQFPLIICYHNTG